MRGLMQRLQRRAEKRLPALTRYRRPEPFPIHPQPPPLFNLANRFGPRLPLPFPAGRYDGLELDGR